MNRDKLFNSDEVPPVQTLMEILGMNQLQFANLVGVYPSTVSRWVRGLSEPQFTAGGFKKLIAALEPHGIQLEDLPDVLGRPAGQS